MTTDRSSVEKLGVLVGKKRWWVAHRNTTYNRRCIDAQSGSAPDLCPRCLYLYSFNVVSLHIFMIASHLSDQEVNNGKCLPSRGFSHDDEICALGEMGRFW